VSGQLDSESAPQIERASQRLRSLDAFRGIAILGMLLVNNKALGPWTPTQLTHAGWDEGAHLADMVYPWFLLIVGVAIPYSAVSHLRRHGSWGSYFWKVFRRSLLLVLLGCLINSSYAKRPIFDLGVLQLIGFSYFAAALLYRLPFSWRMAAAGLFLVGHWALIRFLPIPGVGSGAFARETNVIAYLNQTYLARWGLENLPVVFPTTALVLIGTALGDAVRAAGWAEMRKVWIVVGVGVTLVVGGGLWGMDLPLNKRVWTSPYVLLAAGWGSVVLGLCYLLIDVKRRQRWALPLVVMGVNALTAFVAPILVNIYVLNGWGWQPAHGSFVTVQQAMLRFLTAHGGAGPGGLLYTASYLLAWWLILLWMYRRRVFFRV
jgi:predicted acyltransferase